MGLPSTLKAALACSLLFVVACTGKKDEERVAPPGAVSPVATAPAPTAPAPSAPPAEAPPAAAETKLDCDRILSKELRDKYFAGKTFTDSPTSNAWAGECRVMTADGGVEVRIAASCPPSGGDVAAMATALKAQKKDAKDLPAVGAAALLETQAGGQLVTAWDDDSPCQVELALPASVDAAAVTRDFLAGLPPR